MFFTDTLEGQRKQLQRKLDRYRHLLVNLRRSHLIFRSFTNWDQIISFFKSLNWNDPGSDQILIPILKMVQQKNDAGWNVVITMLFWHILISLFKRLSKYGLNYPDELWQRIYHSFIDSVHNIDLQAEKYTIAVWIFRKVKDSVRDSYRSDWKRQKRFLNIDDDPFKNLIGDDPSEEVRVRYWISRFQNLRRKGLISEIEYHLIIGDLIYGKTLHDCAFDLGLTYENAKKLRQRALKKIRDYEEKLSPNTQFDSLLKGRRRLK